MKKPPSTILSLCAILVAITSRAAQVSVTIDSLKKDLVAYCFSSSNLQNALPNAPDGTIVYVWDVAAQQYNSSTLFGGTWFPDRMLTPGQGFFIANPLEQPWTYTIQGTELTASSFTLSFPDPAKQYLVGSAYNIDVAGGGNWLECMKSDCIGHHTYTAASYHYVGNNGDTVWLWCSESDAWSESYIRFASQDCPGGIDEWSSPFNCLFCAPQLTWGENCASFVQSGGHGRGIMLQPAGGTTNWVQLIAGQDCGP